MNLLRDGVQIGIPLSLLTVKDGAIDASRLGEPLATHAAPLLATLFASGAIAAGEAKAPVVALRLKAKMPGTAGNTLKITFSNVAAKTPVENSEATVTISYKDRREGLTKDTVGAELGILTGGTKPGLVTLKAPAAELPATLTATPLSSASPPDLDILAADTTTAFAVQATGTQTLFKDVKVTIPKADATAGTFTLVISLDLTESDVKLGDIASKYAPLMEVVGAVAAAPAEGEIKLAGGADPETSTAKAAEASVLSD